LINRLNNSKFNALTRYKVQKDKQFEIEECDPWLEEAIKVYNYEGEKPLPLSFMYVNNLMGDLRRLRNEKDIKVAMGSIAYLTITAGFIEHTPRIKLIEVATEEFKIYIHTATKIPVFYVKKWSR
jgi:hypothetical protein